MRGSARPARDRLQGTLDLLILKTLSAQNRAHGYAITLHVQKASNEALRVEEGSLYPALHRMTSEGWLKAAWGTSDNNRRARYYSLTPSGKRRLSEEEKNWAELTDAVARVLAFT